MADKKQIMSWLEGLAQDDWPMYHSDSEVQEIAKVTLDLLEKLLKEQEAVPVIQREIMHMLFWCCGSCGVAITDGDKFCRNCGKQVKWNENT